MNHVVAIFGLVVIIIGLAEGSRVDPTKTRVAMSVAAFLAGMGLVAMGLAL